MATDNIEICNLALHRIGEKSITTLSDNTAAATACSLFYARTVKALLTAYDWPFATTAADLGTATETDVSGWSYVYTLPADYLRGIRLEDQGQNGSDTDDAAGATTLYDYEIRGASLYTDIEDAWLIYVQSITDTTLFPIEFEEALIFKLAADIAMSLTGDPQIESAMLTQYQTSVQMAQAIQSDVPTILPMTSEYLDARA
jgi:hypothetical protein